MDANSSSSEIKLNDTAHRAALLRDKHDSADDVSEPTLESIFKKTRNYPAAC